MSLPVSPATGAIRTNQPTIRWNPITDARGYTVEIRDASGTVVFSRDVSLDQTELLLSNGLGRGQQYTVIVSALGVIDADSQGEFFVISAEDEQELAAAEEGLSVFEKVELYLNFPVIRPLYTDAIEALQRAIADNPDNFDYTLLLGHVYWEAELPQAKAQYEGILNATTEPAVIAQAEVGLARVALDEQNREQAIALLESALAKFETLGDTFSVAQTYQFLAEMNLETEPAVAQELYSQALEAYQAVEPTSALPEEVLQRYIRVIQKEISPDR
ncbi:MAG: tetratricopeptide repeat protein [Spirulina sp. SIO3F2]|nr:tetratricopeptide repeat protein [Spirulina sp. SIO3F2]